MDGTYVDSPDFFPCCSVYRAAVTQNCTKTSEISVSTFAAISFSTSGISYIVNVKTSMHHGGIYKHKLEVSVLIADSPVQIWI